MGKLYQIYEKSDSGANAGSKAPKDIERFAREEGFATLCASCWGDKRNFWGRLSGQVLRLFEYASFFLKVGRNSVLFMQFPYVRGGRAWRWLFLRSVARLKNVRIVTLIHDLNELRNIDVKYQERFVRYSIGLSSAVIVHNSRMADYLAENGIPREKMVCLEAFDYFTAEPPSLDGVKFDRSLYIAGNLDSVKCGYLRDIPKIGGINFQLYGMHYSGVQNERVRYHGAFSPEGLPHEISTGFGLVWDGDSVDTCSGAFGNYLRYNNPHKFSLYIASGIPVVAWRESALAEFVERNRCGILVGSLREAAERISSMGEDEYAHIRLNALSLAEKIRAGHFTKRALREALGRVAPSLVPFSATPDLSRKPIVLAMACDDNYVRPTGTAIASILISNPGERFVIYLLTQGLRDDSIDILDGFAGRYSDRLELKVTLVDGKDFADCPIRENDHVSIVSYFRIILPQIVPSESGRILYIDGDVLCIDSLRDFYDMELDGYAAATVHDERNDDDEIFERLEYPKANGYFGAGVMLINLDWWRERDVQGKCFDFIRKNPEKCLWHDQDALNKVLNGNVKWADFRYNFTQGFFFDKSALLLDEKYFPDIDSALENPCILHFSATYKPWHVECNSPCKRMYREFYRSVTGEKLPLTRKLFGIERFKWNLKRVLNAIGIRRFMDFRKGKYHNVTYNIGGGGYI